jgi:hypothetical protein
MCQAIRAFFITNLLFLVTDSLGFPGHNSTAGFIHLQFPCRRIRRWDTVVSADGTLEGAAPSAPQNIAKDDSQRPRRRVALQGRDANETLSGHIGRETK